MNQTIYASIIRHYSNSEHADCEQAVIMQGFQGPLRSVEVLFLCLNKTHKATIMVNCEIFS